MENRENDEIEIDLWGIVRALWNKAWIICLAAVIFAGAAFGVSKFAMTPTYQSQAEIMILNRQNGTGVTSSDLSMSTNLTADYKYLITSRYVLEEVIAELSLDMTTSQLASKIALGQPTSTHIVSITVTDTDPAMAMNIANAVKDVAIEQIKKIMEIEAINTVTEASLPKNPSSPAVMKYTVLGGMLGFILAAGVIVVRFIMDDSIKTPDDVSRYLGLSTLANIPLQEEERKKKHPWKKRRTKEQKKKDEELKATHIQNEQKNGGNKGDKH